MKTTKSLLVGSLSALGLLLGATAVSASPSPTMDEAPPPAAFDAKTSFNDTCAKCHAEDGKGGTKIGNKLKTDGKRMPDLSNTTTDAAKFEAIIANGVPDTAMKGYANKFKPEEVKALADYAKTFKK